MNHSIEDMRHRAALSRAAAEAEPLANARQKHLDAAESWERLARRAEAMKNHTLRSSDVLPAGTV